MNRPVRKGILTFLILLGFTGLAAAQRQAGKPVVLEPKYKMRIQRNVLIPMRDGIRLSADLFFPDAEGKFPAVIQYQPYRKDDVTHTSGSWFRYFAERGIVGVQLDVRGTGGSEGINTDEYMPVEQQDGYDAIEWLARQPWCNGNVGMIGASYGGFTCIQVAMHQPPHLKAIVPIYATDDRYTDDCHYTRGGNMRMYYDAGFYGGWMVAMNALPPYPELSGERWVEMWKTRLEHNEPYIPKWMHQQVDGSYWRYASLRPGYDRILCPVFLIDGWHDGYPNPELRAYMHLRVPKKLLMGPWVHELPDGSVPGPRINYLNEVTRFFNQYLKGEDTGIMEEPRVTFYMQEYATPERTIDIVPGYWRNDPDFPVPGTKEMTFYLQENGVLASRPGPNQHSDSDEYEYIPTLGLSNGYWSGGGIAYYLPDDQRADEAYSQVYTTAPFEQEVRILGWPQAILHASSSAQVVTFVTKLADVAPDGHSALIVDGSLNGTRRESLTDPTPMKPGEIYELKVPMLPTGWVLKPGHRLRVAVSSSDFPNIWPTPEKARNRIYRGGRYPSRVVLPVVPQSSLSSPHFVSLRQEAGSSDDPSPQQVIIDQFAGNVTVTKHSTYTSTLDDNRGLFTSDEEFRCSANSRDPAHASIMGIHKFVLEREDGVTEVVGESSIRATETAFHIIINLNVTRNGKPFFHKEWTATEPRRLL